MAQNACTTSLQTQHIKDGITAWRQQRRSRIVGPQGDRTRNKWLMRYKHYVLVLATIKLTEILGYRAGRQRLIDSYPRGCQLRE